MTARDRLHDLVDQLDDEAAERLLAVAHTLVPAPRTPSTGRLPLFVGSFSSGHTDISERAEDILREELGRPRDPS